MGHTLIARLPKEDVMKSVSFLFFLTITTVLSANVNLKPDSNKSIFNQKDKNIYYVESEMFKLQSDVIINKNIKIKPIISSTEVAMKIKVDF